MNRFIKLEIPKMRPICLHCQTKWSQDMICNSFVYEDIEGKWIRQDACDLCWQAQSKKRGDDPISSERFYWKSKVNLKAKSDLPQIEQMDKPLELLRSLLSTANESSKGEAFVLALFLKRKKKLSERKEISQSDGETFILYEDLFSQEVFTVPKVSLNTLQVDKIQQELKLKI